MITDVTVIMARMKPEKQVVLLNVFQLRLSTTEAHGMDVAAITSLTVSNSFPVPMTSMALPPTSTQLTPTGPLSECRTVDGHILPRVFQVQIVSPSLVVNQPGIQINILQQYIDIDCININIEILVAIYCQYID